MELDTHAYGCARQPDVKRVTCRSLGLGPSGIASKCTQATSKHPSATSASLAFCSASCQPSVLNVWSDPIICHHSYWQCPRLLTISDCPDAVLASWPAPLPAQPSPRALLDRMRPRRNASLAAAASLVCSKAKLAWITDFGESSPSANNWYAVSAPGALQVRVAFWPA